MVKFRAFSTKIRSVLTCHRFCCQAGLPVRLNRVQRLGGTPPLCPFDGHESAHSKALWLRLRRAESIRSSVVEESNLDFYRRIKC